MKKYICGNFNEVFSIYTFDYLVPEKNEKNEDTTFMFEFRICVIGIDEKSIELSNVFAKHFKTICLEITLDNEPSPRKENILNKHVESCDRRVLDDEPNIENIKNSNFYLVAIPHLCNNDLSSLYLEKLSVIIGETINSGDIIVCESSIDLKDCVQKVEEISGLKRDEGFFVAYRPKLRLVAKDGEVVSTKSASPELSKIVDDMYAVVCKDNVRERTSKK